MDGALNSRKRGSDGALSFLPSVCLNVSTMKEMTTTNFAVHIKKYLQPNIPLNRIQIYNRSKNKMSPTKYAAHKYS
jgi:hypothetical protein